jgi:glycine cleavage system regulatory protein
MKEGEGMKRFALVAFGPGRGEIGELFNSLFKNGCTIDSCLLTSTGNGFSAAIMVLGWKSSVSKAVSSLKNRLVIKASPVEKDGQALPGNLQITLYGPNRPETISLLSNLIASEDGEITEIESRSVGDMSVVALQACCPGRPSGIRARLMKLSKKLGLKASFERIKPEDLL